VPTQQGPGTLLLLSACVPPVLLDCSRAPIPPPRTTCQAMARWFCGVPSVWELFSAPLIPERCYFSATITRAELEHRGVLVFDNESACR
jgi:hypothetical protein